MGSYIKPLSSFDSVNEDFSLSSLFKGFGGAIESGLNFLGAGFINTIKQKFAAFLMERLGVVEESPLSKIVQEVVEEIEINEYIGLISGKNANVEFFVPKFSSAIVDFLQRTGFDGIAQSIGIETNGYLYNTLREALEERLSKSENLKEDIEKVIFSALNPSISKLSSIMDPKNLVGSMSSPDRRSAISKIAKEAKKAGYANAEKNLTSGSVSSEGVLSTYIDSLLKNPTGASSTGAKSTLNNK